MKLEIDIRHRFDGLDLHAAFQVQPGQVTALFGPSGCGKTTVANAVAGLLRPDSGRIAMGGQVLFDAARGVNLAPHRRRIGYVFQDARLFPHLTVAGNLRYPARFLPRARRPDPARITTLLGLTALLDRRTGALSGGERQRVAIARALLSDPSALVLDEPLSALDPARKSGILPWLERLRDHLRLPILYISHATDELARLADQVVLMRAGHCESPRSLADLLSDPVLGPALGPREEGALIRATIGGDAGDGLTHVLTEAGPMLLSRNLPPEGATIALRIFAHEVLLSRDRPDGLSALNALPATVICVTPQSPAEALVQLRAGQARLLARVTARSVRNLSLAPGTPCHALVKSVALARA
ncbi:molybdenum ABC transporter ATP-binding protein [Paracoccus jiaweipingae]|uniref:molybdenum ABC transporter ATP-binding protein n=1 Tax=unclassified Paracoccus (in: a-proteobacteria) TaxID=2688777 RepID=UPI0037A6A728